jgi:hypothetical protein
MLVPMIAREGFEAILRATRPHKFARYLAYPDLGELAGLPESV